MYSFGETDLSISLGAVSFNFSTGSFGYLGKRGNSKLENIGYGLGAIANLNDIAAGINPGKVQLNTDTSDKIGHSALTKANEMDPNNSIISIGPKETGKHIFNPLYFGEADSNWPNYADYNTTQKIIIEGVNVNRIMRYGQYLQNAGKYNLYFSSCVTHTSNALSLSGVLSIGIHPHILSSQIYLHSLGIRPSLLSHYMYSLNQK